MPVRQVTEADVQTAEDIAGLTKLFAKLGYDTSSPADQTSASLGVADRAQAMVRQARRIAAEKAPAGPLPALEIYWFEVTSLTAELRRALASAFRNKPLLRYLLVLSGRDFAQLDFVLVEKTLSQAAAGALVTVSHQLFSVDRRHPLRVHMRVINRFANTASDPYAQSERIRDAFRLAEWSQDEFNNRNLFSDYFLKHRLTQQSLFPVWHGDFKPAYDRLSKVFAAAADVRSLTENDYLDKFILPMMAGLGFACSPAKGDGQPDYLLKPADGAAPCAALLAYPWDRPLDRKDDQQGRSRSEDVPGIRIVKVLEEQKLPWAILTNGKDWRLYCAAAHSRASNYYEIDLADAIEQEDLNAFRYFYLFFRAESFVAANGRPSLLEQIREGSTAFAKELGDRLRKQIFGEVFPYLAQGFVDYRRQHFDEKTVAGDAFLTQAYDATLTLLYRLLFLLYAEALDLVPINEPAYARLSLTRLKNEIAQHAGADADAVETRLKTKFTKSDTQLYDRLATLVAAIDTGSKEHNVPAYNGGLFSTSPEVSDNSREAEAARFLKKYRVPDFYLARALDLLARGEDSKTGQLEFIDYKSLGVRQLGSIYEGLLMYHVVIPAEDWEKQFHREGLKVALVPSNKERKSTGSYFTPQHIVSYIVAQTVGPLLEEKFKEMAPKLRAAQRLFQEQKKYEEDRSLAPALRKAEEIVLRKYGDVVHELLDVKVLDPAMGSGHFLVETVDFITDRVLDFIAGFPWNPVQVFVEERIRGPIIASLESQGVKINEQRLTDVNLIKRLVMKRCVYGVDLNPMAVELAKVSVWLDSFTIGAPLSFMDHHFRCGNSLIGSSTADLKKAIADSGSLFAATTEPLERATRNMELIAYLSDATLDEVHRSSSTYESVLKGMQGYRVLLDCLTAEHFGVEGAAGLIEHGGDLDLGDWDASYARLSKADKDRVDRSVAVSRSRRFFHWDIDFPDVFFTARRLNSMRAFDVVVGNPPWGGLRSLGDLERHLSQALRTAKKGTDWFALFVESEIRLTHPGGRVGAVLPSGWQSADESADFRAFVEGCCSLDAFVNLPYDTFDDANVDACIVTLSRGCFGGSARILTYPVRECVRAISMRDPRWQQINTKVWSDVDPGGHQWFTLMDPEELAVAFLIRERSVPLGSVAQDIQRGISPYDPEMRSPGSRYDYCLDGELRRYTVDYSGKCCTAYHAALAEFKERSLFEGPRTILRQLISRQFRPQAVSEDRFFLVNQSHQIVRVVAPLTHHSITGLLNSALLAFWHVRRSALARRDDFPKLVLEDTKGFPVPKSLVARRLEREELHSAVEQICEMDTKRRELEAQFNAVLQGLMQSRETMTWPGASAFQDVDYLGWTGRFPDRSPRRDPVTLGQSSFANRVAPPLNGNNGAKIPWNLVASVYPSITLPGIDGPAWESAAWEEFCDFLRKNKTKIANAKIRADLTGRESITNPTGPLKKLQETFLKFHREIRENRAKGAELDFLIDRIVFKLFDLTIEEQKLILSRVGPGRPLPPRRRRGKKRTSPAEESNSL